MPRYIDANKLEELCDIMAEKCDGIGESIWNQFRTMVEFSPTADVVEVVKCRDCKHYENGFCYNPNTYDDEKTRGNTIPNWFCADGERKGNED